MSGTHVMHKTKKLVIKNFKVKPRLPDNYEEETWKKLHDAVLAFQKKTAVPYSLEELYQSCENLCHHHMAEALYNRLREVCEKRIREERQHVLRLLKDQQFLRALNQSWHEHCRQMLMIRSIFLYLDRTYVLQNKNLLSIWDLGLALYREYIFEDEPSIRQHSFYSLLNEIQKERNGEAIDRSLMKSLVRMLIDLKMYTGVFEQRVIDASAEFYRAESERLSKTLSLSDYLHHSDRRLREEADRVVHYLDGYTRKALIMTVERECLAVHVPTLLAEGFYKLMDSDKLQDLKLLYGLCFRVGALEQMRLYFADYIKSRGSTLVTKDDNGETMISDLLNFKMRLDTIIREALQLSDAAVETVKQTAKTSAVVGKLAAQESLPPSVLWKERFMNTLKESFEAFINRRQCKSAELIARYLDQLLKSDGKGAGEQNMESLIDQVLVLFRFIQGKDVFEAFYKNDLSKRLLMIKTSSLDGEKRILSKLRTECGPGFTSKLEGMFKDMDLSRDIMHSFKTSSFYERVIDIELSVDVLTQGFWPVHPDFYVILPEQLKQCQKGFEEFYSSKHTGRNLQWQNSLGHCLVKSHINGNVHELQVSLFQTVVLLCFNDTNQLSYKDIHQQTAIEHTELKRTLQSLACSKYKLLSKSPKGKDVDESDTFAFNSEFTCKLRRVKVNQIQMKQTTDEIEQTQEQVFLDRQYQVDAAIVRVMKTRKLLSHAKLVADVFEICKFPMSAVDIKKRIESLIDREYLEKNEQGYKYLA